ncbi:Glycosyl phosphatidyl inositol protein transamidase complex subunit [Coemansia sp. RSA 552]|nr:Glycosyl phosphatidyl inositol protein transamidase complex subunit [Coemansia sp. RSA 552]
MSLVLSGQSEKTSPLLRLARRYSAYLSYPLALAGIAWLLLLPATSHKAYFSENAMMPGQVVSVFDQEHLAAVDKLDDALSTHGKSEAVRSVFAAMGLDTETQRFTYDEVPGVGTRNGHNVHGIVRAPRGDSVEALLIAASWTTAESNVTNVNAVRLMAALAEYASQQVYWARDIIFLVTDAGEHGVETWLRAYHGEPVSGDPLSTRSGIIQGALSLELPPAQSYTGLGLYYEGKGGQLANLDFLNLVQHMGQKERFPVLFHGMKDVPRRASTWTQYMHAARLLLRQVQSQAFGSSAGVHAPFLRYRIDALTLSGIVRENDPTAQMVRQLDQLSELAATAGVPMPSAKAMQATGRIVEGTLRSLNNLLEHFHQSFFFYMVPASRRYISIGDYIPAAGLIIASLLFQAMHLWWMQGPDDLRVEGPETRIPRINKYYGLLRRTIPSSVGIILRVHMLGVVLLLLPTAISYAVLTDTTTTAYLFTMALGSVSMVLHISDIYWAESARAAVEWRQLKALVELYVAVTVACLSVMNMSLAVALFAVAGLPLLLTRVWSTNTRPRRIMGLLLLLLASPVCTMTLGRNVALGLHPLDLTSSPFRMFLGDFYHFGSLVYPLVCLVYWPVNLLSMIIVLIP